MQQFGDIAGHEQGNAYLPQDARQLIKEAEVEASTQVRRLLANVSDAARIEDPRRSLV